MGDFSDDGDGMRVLAGSRCSGGRDVGDGCCNGCGDAMASVTFSPPPSSSCRCNLGDLRGEWLIAVIDAGSLPL